MLKPPPFCPFFGFGRCSLHMTLKLALLFLAGLLVSSLYDLSWGTWATLVKSALASLV